jgi:hypothetical protein
MKGTLQATATELATILTACGSHAETLPGKKICRERITGNVAGADFSYFHLQDVEAKGLTFSKCVFQHSVFERCYFRNAVFESCDFTGARFIDTNLRGAKLIICKLEYTSYRGTVLDRGQFASNLPPWENVRAEVARSLRINAQGLGDVEGVNFFINVEMDGTLEHWWKAFQQRESYYQQKYRGFHRFEALGRYAYYRLLRLAWGHGESPMRILRNTLLLLCLFAFWLTLDNLSSVGEVRLNQLVTTAAESCVLCLRVFLGVPLTPGHRFPPGFDLALVALRYISVAFFFGVLSKRLTRR